jgi:Asp-tRNA(Asn)/Glu-tRNA(Gln) amidotransferase A subunit family amidase
MEANTHSAGQEPSHGASIDSSTKGRYSVAHYRSLYLSGEITPLAVARVILPMIRRDTFPPGEHSTAWISVKADLVLKAAEVSTLRYQENRSLGPLDGILAAIKDEYDVEGYATSLGSARESMDERQDSKKLDSWCISKLKDAGVIIVGKVSMVEYGMGKAFLTLTY